MLSLRQVLTRLRPLRPLNTFLKPSSSTAANESSREDSSPPKQLTKKILPEGPTLKDFLINSSLENSHLEVPLDSERIPYLNDINEPYGLNRKVYFDVYGCQMNVNDTEIIWSILKRNGYCKTASVGDADIVLIITCSIREKAELKVWHRLNYLKALRQKKLADGHSRMKIGILGCMAERLKQRVLEKEKSVDVIAGPDSYKDLPRLLAVSENNQTAINVMLSLDETYADIMPVRLNEDSVTAFVSIMRGCDNMCTYCIVPFTRGRERSRPVNSILDEIRNLSEQGVKEVTLLGQNVNSYRDVSEGNKHYMSSRPTNLVKGFKTVYKSKLGGMRFADLLERAADVDPEMRIRFTSPHPKDFPDEVLQAIKWKANICKSLHLPAQSGNSIVLERMRRGYTREAYLELVDHIRSLMPSISLSSDFICGFCGETEDQFQDTLTLIDQVRYNMAYLFMYSMREKTAAYRSFKDDVDHDVKTMRLIEMSDAYRKKAEEVNKDQVGQAQLVLVEGVSKKSAAELQGRNDGNTKVIFPNKEVVDRESGHSSELRPGDYVMVQIESANSQVLKGAPLYRSTLTKESISIV